MCGAAPIRAGRRGRRSCQPAAARRGGVAGARLPPAPAPRRPDRVTGSSAGPGTTSRLRAILPGGADRARRPSLQVGGAAGRDLAGGAPGHGGAGRLGGGAALRAADADDVGRARWAAAWCPPSPARSARGGAEEAAALVLHAVLIAVAAGLLFAVLLARLPARGARRDRRAGGGGGGGRLCRLAVRRSARCRPGWPTPWPPCCAAAGGMRWRRACCCSAWLAYPLLAWVLAEPLGIGLAGLGDGVRRGVLRWRRRRWRWWCCAAARASCRRSGCGRSAALFAAHPVGGAGGLRHGGGRQPHDHPGHRADRRRRGRRSSRPTAFRRGWNS